jgi:hypothetical protein
VLLYQAVRCFIFGLVLIIFNSCKSSRVVFTELKNPEEVLFQRLQESSLAFDWFSAKAKVRLESNETIGGGRMNIRMKKDSIIWFNFKKVSIEGARGLISPYEFTLIYRTEKKYEAGKLSELLNENTIPMSFSEVQSFLAGNIPIPCKKDLLYKRDQKSHILIGENEKYTITYSFSAELNLDEVIMTDGENRILAIQVDNKDEDLGIYKKRKLTYYNNQIKKGTLEVDLSNIEVDVPKKIPFFIPDHYTGL